MKQYKMTLTSDDSNSLTEMVVEAESAQDVPRIWREIMDGVYNRPENLANEEVESEEARKEFLEEVELNEIYPDIPNADVWYAYFGDRLNIWVMPYIQLELNEIYQNNWK